MSWCSVCSFLIVVCLPFSCAAENRGNGLNGLVLNGTSGVGQTATDDKRDESFGYSDLSVDTQPQQHHPHHHQHHVSNKKNKHYRSSFFNGKAKSSKKYRPVKLSSFELSPSKDQLVFEGDTLNLVCRVSDRKRNIKLTWFKNGSEIKGIDLIKRKPLRIGASDEVNDGSDDGNYDADEDLEDEEVVIRTTNNSLDGRNTQYVSSISIKHLAGNHTGNWICLATTPRGNASRTVNVVVMQSRVTIELKARNQGTFFRLPHPSFYFGSLISVPCLLIVILVYSFSFSAIQMPRKTKVSLINTWLAFALLITVFGFGVKQTYHILSCQIIGLTLHYLTLSCFLWMIISVSNLYSSLTKHRKLGEADSECCDGETIDMDNNQTMTNSKLEQSADPKPKPLMGYYLFGWGIAVIICGISSAVSITNYSGDDYCFMSLTTSISIIYGPVVFLGILLLIFFLLIRCLLGGMGTNTVSPGLVPLTGVENISLKNGNGSKSIIVKVTIADDDEWTYKKQLCSHLLMFSLFLFMWLSACLGTILKPIQRCGISADLLSDELLFGVLFSVLSSSLSIYILVHFCFNRKDVRQSLFSSKCTDERNAFLSHKFPSSQELSRLDTNGHYDNVPVDAREDRLPSGHLEQTAQETNQVINKLNNTSTVAQPTDDPISSQFIQISSGTKFSTNQLDGLSESHQSKSPSSGTQINSVVNNVNFPHLINDTSISSEVFLNPRLNAIAKKFFEKNRRRQLIKMIERNNLNGFDEGVQCVRKLSQKSLLSPKVPNYISSDLMKAKSEIVPLTSLGKNGGFDPPITPIKKFRRSPCSPRKLKGSHSARDMNIYCSSPNVDMVELTNNNGKPNPVLHRGQSPTSSQTSRRKHLKSSSSIPLALQCQASELLLKDFKANSDVMSVCCQSDIISSVSHPWSCSSRKSKGSKKSPFSHGHDHRNGIGNGYGHDHRHRRHRGNCCDEGRVQSSRVKPILETVKDTQPFIPKIDSGLITSPASAAAGTTVSSITPRRRRRRRRMSTRSSERSGGMKEYDCKNEKDKHHGHQMQQRHRKCHHFPRSRSVTDNIPDCNCRFGYCSSSD